MEIERENFVPKYNVVAATIMFNRAINKGDSDGAMEIAKICVEAQEATETTSIMKG